jgi:hypothetical protein
MFSCTRHPLVPIPDDETLIALHKQKGPDAVQKLLEAREEVIRLSKEDPLKHGFDLESWHRIRWALKQHNEVLVLGGNRSAKTTGIAKLFMEAITTHMDGHVVLFSQNADTSVKVQQASMWEFMPKEFKRKTKGIEGYINYSMQNGFTGQSFIFPIQGLGWTSKPIHSFPTTTQFWRVLSLVSLRAGRITHENLGIGNDEYLGDSRLINTQRFRLATRDSKLGYGLYAD